MANELAKKLVEVMKDCSHVVKGGVNSFHHYKYVTAADVQDIVNDALTKQGIAVTYESNLHDIREVKTAKGNTEQLVTVDAIITLIDSESGETLKLKGLGSGQDAGDKSITKAQTAAVKYAFLKGFVIADEGEDPEKDTNTNAYYGSTEYSSSSYRSSSGTSKANTSNGNGANGWSGDGKTIVGQCEDCGADVNEKSAYYSRKNHNGALLCYNCQQARRGK